MTISSLKERLRSSCPTSIPLSAPIASSHATRKRWCGSFTRLDCSRKGRPPASRRIQTAYANSRKRRRRRRGGRICRERGLNGQIQAPAPVPMLWVVASRDEVLRGLAAAAEDKDEEPVPVLVSDLAKLSCEDLPEGVEIGPMEKIDVEGTRYPALGSPLSTLARGKGSMVRAFLQIEGWCKYWPGPLGVEEYQRGRKAGIRPPAPMTCAGPGRGIYSRPAWTWPRCRRWRARLGLHHRRLRPARSGGAAPSRRPAPRSLHVP